MYKAYPDSELGNASLNLNFYPKKKKKERLQMECIILKRKQVFWGFGDIIPSPQSSTWQSGISELRVMSKWDRHIEKITLPLVAYH